MNDIVKKIRRNGLKRKILDVFERNLQFGDARQGYDCCMKLESFGIRYSVTLGNAGNEQDFAEGLEACIEDGDLHYITLESINGQKEIEFICRK